MTDYIPFDEITFKAECGTASLTEFGHRDVHLHTRGMSCGQNHFDKRREDMAITIHNQTQEALLDLSYVLNQYITYKNWQKGESNGL